MIVLIADKFEQPGIDGLKQLGCEVIYEPKLNGDSLADALARSGAEVLVVRSTKVPDAVQQAANRLRLIIRAGSGYDTIDIDAARRRNVAVANCPGKNAVAVAELTLALICALDRRIPDNVFELREGKWNKQEYSQARGLKGRTLGIIGIGQIGREVIRRAAAFEMPIVGWSRSLTPEKAADLGIEYAPTPRDVAARADILTVHLASTPDTRGIINADIFDALKPGAFFINTARADLVDYDALKRAIREKNIRAGLDVFPGEPPEKVGRIDPDLFRLPGVVYGTHHIGASTEQAQLAVADEVVRIVRHFRDNGEVLNRVN